MIKKYKRDKQILSEKVLCNLHPIIIITLLFYKKISFIFIYRIVEISATSEKNFADCLADSVE
ncbi:hypothetical protein AXF12_01620 [Capnocytophaga haemolytica]|uniref:Uncharacterized protein n=1 Tax=Capnocytophaga haemolytica TaxID=45243 RepID=A0ABM5XB04_9FLAO|nr:hypothetical protein AXF12_01620 [Capnocytophaga haemolytica]